MTTEDQHLDFIETSLIPWIASNLFKLQDEVLDFGEKEHPIDLDGLISSLYKIKLTMKTAGGINNEHFFIVKFMEGNEILRQSTKSNIQFANEIFLYAKLLPAYHRILKAARITSVQTEDWAPRAFFANFGYLEGLSPTNRSFESVIVLQNLEPLGYRRAPHHYLNRDHLLSMSKTLGEFHALSFVMRERYPPWLKTAKSQLMPLPFTDEDDDDDADSLDERKPNQYSVLYRIAFDRFFEFFDRTIDDGSTFDRKSEADLKLIEDLNRLRERHFKEPTRLMERLGGQEAALREDRRWAVFNHGEFNANNMLFAYKGAPVAGEKKEEMEAGETKEQLVAGENKEEMEAGETKEELVAGEKKEELVAGEKEKELVAGEKNEEMEAGETKEELVAGETKEDMEAGETKEELVAGEKKEEMEAGETKEELVAGEKKEELVAGETKEELVAGETKKELLAFENMEELVAGEKREKLVGVELLEPEVCAVKMIDFQQLRYGSIAIDLSFFMYLNISENIRATIWMDILLKYHTQMFGMLESIVKAGKTDLNKLREIDYKLDKYNFDYFYIHFSRYAMYGVISCMHYLPWIMCSEEERERFTMLYKTDMHGAEFRQHSMEAGGDEVNLRLLDIMRHASNLGYMDQI